MIELFGGLDDYAGQLRRLFGLRGEAQPLGSDIVQPTVLVGPELPSPWGPGTPFTVNYNDSIPAASQASVQLLAKPGEGYIARLLRLYVEYEPLTVTPIVTLSNFAATTVGVGGVDWPLGVQACEVGAAVATGRIRALGSTFAGGGAISQIRRGYQRTLEHVFEDFTCFPGTGLQIVLQNLDGGPRLCNATVLGVMFPYQR